MTYLAGRVSAPRAANCWHQSSHSPDVTPSVQCSWALHCTQDKGSNPGTIADFFVLGEAVTQLPGTDTAR